MTSTFALWHGAHRWDGKPDIRAPRAGHAEHGAGIYCTTEYTTAQKYASGGGRTRLMQIDTSIRLLEDLRAPVDIMIAAVKDIPRLRAKQAILDDLRWSAEQRGSDVLGLNTVINLASHYNALSGNAAVGLTEFVASQGADASLYERGGEDWLVIFNPTVIRSSVAVAPNNIDLTMFSLTRVRQHLANTSPTAAVSAGPAP